MNEIHQSRPWLKRGLKYFERANMIGDVLFPKLEDIVSKDKFAPNFVTSAKITGMLIELPIKEVDALLLDDKKLQEKYEEAKQLLINHFNQK